MGGEAPHISEGQPDFKNTPQQIRPDCLQVPSPFPDLPRSQVIEGGPLRDHCDLDGGPSSIGWQSYTDFRFLVWGDGSKPYKFIGFGDSYGSKPYKFIGLGDSYGPKPYNFTGFGC